MFDVGATELLLVAVLAVMLYGGDLPDVARRAGGTMKRLRGVADDLKRQVTLPPELDVKDVKAELRKIPQHLGDLRRDLSSLPPPAPASRPAAPETSSAEPPSTAAPAPPAAPPDAPPTPPAAD